MNIKSPSFSSLFLKSIFVFSLFLLIFISSVSYRHTTSISDSTKWVMHSYKANMELQKLLSFLKDAETSQRGYIITKDSIFLETFNGTRQKVNSSFISLKKLTADNLKQQNNLETLYLLINKRYNYFTLTLNQSQANPFKSEKLKKEMIIGKNVMDDIRSLVGKMIQLEDTYLEERKLKYEKNISITPIFTLFTLFFSLTIFCFSFYKMNNDLKDLTKANEVLMVTTESVKHAEKIGEFCVTQWNLKKNKLEYSENLYGLLGCEINSFEPTVENYLKFVHPEDKHIITTAVKNIETSYKVYPRQYRIIRKDGEIRHLKSIGKMLPDNSTHIGIITDVTQEYLNQQVLEQRNEELEQINKELESFNHVASHDLQEPLRKIQTFISRISNQDMELMSQTGKEYINKIQISANRMRVLIDDLLLYSRTNKKEKVFYKTDLNLLLEYSKQELANIIEDKNATIIANKLPIIGIIPFQIQQLFTNLLNNSLKYSRIDVSPIIKIHCEKIAGSDYPNLKINNLKKYYKISFSDNGMGFEQEFAENIFILFNRLHTVADYPGTGIGLSICKKITENHLGTIYAEGKPNVGSVFTIFLPE